MSALAGSACGNLPEPLQRSSPTALAGTALLSLAGAESLLQALHHRVAVVCDLERGPVTFCFP